jgi:hypothetical protein
MGKNHPVLVPQRNEFYEDKMHALLVGGCFSHMATDAGMVSSIDLIFLL